MIKAFQVNYNIYIRYMPRFEKGSDEAIEHMRKLREARKPKLAGETKGNGIGDSIKKTFKKASKAVAGVATDAYHMSPADAVKSIKSIGGAVPPPPSRLPSSMFNPVGAGLKDDESSSDDEVKGGRLHDCPMCRGMGIVKKLKR